jgi:hypothetical protein
VVFARKMSFAKKQGHMGFNKPYMRNKPRMGLIWDLQCISKINMGLIWD